MSDQVLGQVLADRIRDARLKTGLSQEECAERAEIHRTQISFLESGRRMPRMETFLKIAGALDVDPLELLGPLRWKPGHREPGAFVDGGDGA